jgi:hypothetical protein
MVTALDFDFVLSMRFLSARGLAHSMTLARLRVGQGGAKVSCGAGPSYGPQK